MFGKLKEKLKGALSVFSKKTKEEAKEIPQEEVDKLIEEKVETKEEAEPVEEKKEVIEKEVEEPVEEKVEIKEEKQEEVIEKEVELVEEEKEIHEPPIEKVELIEEKQEEVIEKEEPVEKEKETPEPPIEKEKKPTTPENLIEETKKKFQEELKEEVEEEKLPSPEELVEAAKKFSEEKKKQKEKRKKEKVKEEVPLAEKLVEEIKEEEKPVEKEESVIEKKPEEKKGFFGRLFSKKEEVKEEKPVVEKEEKKEIKPKEKKQIKEVKEEKSFFGKVKQSLTTKKISTDKFDELFWDLELVLLENNVSVEVIEKIKENLMKELVDKPLPRDVLGKIEATLKYTLDDILSFDKVDIIKNIENKQGPYIMAFFGINGVGKTTSIAKLTHYLQNNGKSVVLAACDTFRAAAIDQLGEHADKLGVKMIKHDYGSDAAAVAYDAIKYAEKNNVDVVMIDTAGRLHSNTNLMAELEKIIRVTGPDMKIFVGESITGNDCIEQARRFNELVEMDGVILTKADVDEKGGAPLSISYVIKKPILFLGVGQEYKDIEEFDKDVILQRLGF